MREQLEDKVAYIDCIGQSVVDLHLNEWNQDILNSKMRAAWRNT